VLDRVLDAVCVTVAVPVFDAVYRLVVVEEAVCVFENVLDPLAVAVADHDPVPDRVPVRLNVPVAEGVVVIAAVLLPVPLGVLPVEREAVGVTNAVGDNDGVKDAVDDIDCVVVLDPVVVGVKVPLPVDEADCVPD
jgi:hypothetical protein